MSVILFGTLLIVVVVLALTAMVMLARGVLMPAHPAVLTVNGTNEFDVKPARNFSLPCMTMMCLCRRRVPEPGPVASAASPCSTSIKATGRSRPRDFPMPTGAPGFIWPARSRLRDDMQVEAPQEWVGATTYTCTVHSVTALTPLIREIVLQLPDEVDATIVAGNYVQVSAPPYALDYASIDVPEAHSAAWQSIKNLTVRNDEEVTRAYSISNRPETPPPGAWCSTFASPCPRLRCPRQPGHRLVLAVCAEARPGSRDIRAIRQLPRPTDRQGNGVHRRRCGHGAAPRAHP
jgi:Na+-transporting NADH:ubiquinone oxidoreductase subunit F